tara:strand:+ start:53 stop:592 length:540 start_codon:yes stop_codon:yes gene_type:complete
MHEGEVKAFTLLMRSQKGVLALGDPSPLRCMYGTSLGVVPLVRDPLREVGVPFGFYMTPLRRLSVGGTTLWENGYVLWDTGSNYLSVSSSTLASIRANIGKGSAPIELSMPRKQGGSLMLSFSDKVYRWSDGTLLCDAHDPGWPKKLNDRVVVVGSLFLSGCALEFMPDRATLRIARLR